MILFPDFIECPRCKNMVEFDEGGVPCDPDHPFYNRWICDDCLDQIGAQSEEGKETKKDIIEKLERLKNNSMSAYDKTDCNGAYFSTYIEGIGVNEFGMIIDKMIEIVKYSNTLGGTRT